MTKEKTRKAKAPKKPAGPTATEVTLVYSLGELPSSQHRAGLAGLILTLQYLARRGHEGVARIDRLEENGATVTFDRAGMKALFDLVYAASMEEKAEKALRKTKNKDPIPPLRTEVRVEVDPKTKKEVQKTLYVYEQVVPAGEVVLDVDPTRSGSSGAWTKLWRDSLWSILRGISKQRVPFAARAANKPTSDAAKCFDVLTSEPNTTVGQASTFLLGAMDRSSDDVPFRDRARFQFLLHFWPTAASVFVPEVEGRDGKRTFWGYAFAIPDVAELAAFCSAWGPVARSRGIEMAGFRPREAVVSLAREAGLAALARLRARLQVASAGSLASVVLAFDVVHAAKPGDAVKISDVGRVEPELPMIDEYARIRSAFRDHAFRRQAIENLMGNAPWHRGFDRLFRTLPHERVLGGYFAHDARTQFDTLTTRNEETMAEPRELEEIILRVVTNYVAGKVNARTKLTWQDAKDDPHKKQEYDDAKERAARAAFLGVRSRTGVDFVDFFAGTLCSVPQRVSNDDFATLSRALRERPDDVRTLTLLALSARS